jgi:hypothetical protein
MDFYDDFSFTHIKHFPVKLIAASYSRPYLHKYLLVNQRKRNDHELQDGFEAMESEEHEGII